MSLRSSLFVVPVLAGAHFAQVTAAEAEVPNVVADMAPIHSLVAQVMGDLGEPSMLMAQGASPHGYAMRPSEAKAVQDADVVFWTGPKIEPWLEEVIEEVGQQTLSVPLATVEGATVLEVREGATFERHVHDEDEHDEDAHDHGDEDHDDHAHEAEDHDDHDHDAHDEDAHDDHDDHDHDDHAEEAHDDHDDHDHAHEGIDGHAWLDPMNARVWLGVISEELAALDAENAETYRTNAAAAQEALDVKIAEIQAEMAPLADMNFIVFHDAYNYFENRFGLSAAGSISISDATAPSPARIREIQDKVKEIGITCVFSEPQFNAGLVNTVLDGTEAKSAVIDPLGVDLTPGAAFYGEFMDELAGAFTACAED
ncbi:zinc ABC transporter solute-binding protein [Celeribacter sp. HF31]|uniref:zinc ABC transporter substrate-binding protein n=1 Tax=Celeribacter sp. HF31 TaxID=2721558 RepID=UPI001431854F|nr:zinc ABC transporter substrate-binding protein [Celeribacter sp. HF31]NIY80977.1 zinc ABC transporter solute-binding protein [Celeribacter sp. HF31]